MLQQISLALSAQRGVAVPATAEDEATRDEHLRILRKALQDDYSGEGTAGLNQRMSPSPMCLPPTHVQRLEALQDALWKALENIVGRWWRDEEAAFPKRMPLEEHEEAVLRWIDGVDDGSGRPFKSSLPRAWPGFFRPDYLLERVDHEDGSVAENVVVCELNARLPFNGYMMMSALSTIYREMGIGESGFKTGSDPDSIRGPLLGAFDTSLPLHLIKDEWPGIDTRLLQEFYTAQTGQLASFVKPSELRVVPDEMSDTGHALYCVISTEDGSRASPNIIEHNGETLSRINQCVVEMIQHEFAALSQTLLRQVATCCINDFRTIFLIHDKRMLGIVQSELPNLVASRVLTNDEAAILEHGIAITVLPGTDAMREVYQECSREPTAKHKYLLKPVRGGMGQDIRFGSTSSGDEWLRFLKSMCHVNPRPSANPLVIQRRIEQLNYDIVRHDLPDVEQPERLQLVGSWLTAGGKYVGHGPWRVGKVGPEGILQLNNDARGIVMGSCLKP